MPAERHAFEQMDQLQRFELRQCNGNGIFVTAYQRAKATPSLVFNTGDGYPLMLAHIENVLILQSAGGSCDHVYVFAFKAGKPSVALQTATKDFIQVRQSYEAVVVSVPPIVYPEPDFSKSPPVAKFPPTPKAKRYRFAVEH
jgi:hypothetical protein